jgi:hypothetical protein
MATRIVVGNVELTFTGDRTFTVPQLEVFRAMVKIFRACPEADCVRCGKHVVRPFTNGWRYTDNEGWWCDTCSHQLDRLEEDPVPSPKTH